ncbi:MULTISPECIES: DUF485 domain-containing protein [unclassified Rhodococcus (in: high G+C Gram-positive bacteria)]|uniref:DUF485 domain-containing protein n=1 Tax=unclassified Rhodococcus (in: high G+C Gram-positive bacteria) TaxID=192944 RepID=UPI000A8FE1AF|nr:MULTISPECIES: DUF485 domain-containing protein [unclassified Rhodococcus (in: high G+C Gram-positive bacteria)]
MTAHDHSSDVAASLYEMSRTRTRLTLSVSALVLAFFLPLPVLGGFTTALDGVVFQGVTVAWLYAFAQFVMAITVARWYSQWAARFDRRLASLLNAEQKS